MRNEMVTVMRHQHKKKIASLLEMNSNFFFCCVHFNTSGMSVGEALEFNHLHGNSEF